MRKNNNRKYSKKNDKFKSKNNKNAKGQNSGKNSGGYSKSFKENFGSLGDNNLKNRKIQEYKHEENNDEKIDKWLRENSRLQHSIVEISINYNNKKECFVLNKYALNNFFEIDKDFYGKTIEETMNKAFETNLKFDIGNLDKKLKEEKFFLKIEYLDFRTTDGVYITVLLTNDCQENVICSNSSCFGTKQSLEYLNYKAVGQKKPVQEDYKTTFEKE